MEMSRVSNLSLVALVFFFRPESRSSDVQIRSRPNRIWASNPPRSFYYVFLGQYGQNSPLLEGRIATRTHNLHRMHYQLECSRRKA